MFKIENIIDELENSGQFEGAIIAAQIAIRAQPLNIDYRTKEIELKIKSKQYRRAIESITYLLERAEFFGLNAAPVEGLLSEVRELNEKELQNIATASEGAHQGNSLLTQIFDCHSTEGGPPMFIKDKKICFFYSHKCGCTTTTKWIFDHEGLLDAANFYRDDPGQFRWNVYYKSDRYNEVSSNFSLEDYNLFIVSRNPYRRLLSAFGHADVRNVVLGKVGYSGAEISFFEFVNIVCRSFDIKADFHYAPQYRDFFVDIEKITKIRKLKIEEGLKGAFLTIEKEYNFDRKMTSAEFDELCVSKHHNRYRPSDGGLGSAVNDKVSVGYNGSLRSPECYFNSDMLDMIYERYESDFLQFNYLLGEF